MKRPLIGLLSKLIAACYSDVQQVSSEDRDAETNVRSLRENLAQVNLFNLSSASDTSARGGKNASNTAQRLCSEGTLGACAGRWRSSAAADRGQQSDCIPTDDGRRCGLSVHALFRCGQRRTYVYAFL